MAGFVRPSLPTELVIHGTGGGSSSDKFINWMIGGERSKEYEKGVALFHYLNDRDGAITEIISPDRWVYHSSSGSHDAVTIGVEHINPNSKNETYYTDNQYKADIELIVFLMDKYPINTIVGHVQNTLKFSGPQYVKVPCPGNYDWLRLQTGLNMIGLNFTLVREECLILQ